MKIQKMIWYLIIFCTNSNQFRKLYKLCGQSNVDNTRIYRTSINISKTHSDQRSSFILYVNTSLIQRIAIVIIDGISYISILYPNVHLLLNRLKFLNNP